MILYFFDVAIVCHQSGPHESIKPALFGMFMFCNEEAFNSVLYHSIINE